MIISLEQEQAHGFVCVRFQDNGRVSVEKVDSEPERRAVK